MATREERERNERGFRGEAKMQTRRGALGQREGGEREREICYCKAMTQQLSDKQET